MYYEEADLGERQTKEKDRGKSERGCSRYQHICCKPKDHYENSGKARVKRSLIEDLVEVGEDLLSLS